MGKRAIVAGHICVDITPVFPYETKYGTMSEILSPGKLINVGPADIHTGGCVSNTGLSMKILGADVKLICKIGKDEFGKTVSAVLSRYGAECVFSEDPESATSYSVILAVPSIDRLFLHHNGANNTFCSFDIPDKSFEDAALIHFGYPTLMRGIYQNNGAELIDIFKRAKRKGLATSLDLAAVDPVSEAGEIDWHLFLKNVLPLTDFFLPSFEEICFMLDRPKFTALKSASGEDDISKIISIENDVAPIADRCLLMGAKIALIKCGFRGMYLKTAKEKDLDGIGDLLQLNTEKWQNKRIFEKSYKVEKVLSATGAGDSSIGAFLSAVLEGETPEEAISIAAATGACCVQAYDAVSGLLSITKLKKKIVAGWKKYDE